MTNEWNGAVKEADQKNELMRLSGKKVGQKITTTERDLLGLIKRRPGAYKYYANRPASATERKRKERAIKKLTLGKALKEKEKKLLGGVGKSTITVNLAYELAKKKKVLLVDCDPQGHSGAIYSGAESKYNIKDLFLDRIGIEKVINPGYVSGKQVKNIDIITSNIYLAKVAEQISSKYHREKILKGKMEKVEKNRNRQTNKYIEKELSNYQEQLCGAKIRKAEVINQSRIANEPLMAFAPHSPVIMDYERLGAEITKITGGKTQLLEIINLSIPTSYNNFIEPFVGGGAVFLNIQPGKVIINDINRELITAYQIIKEKPQELSKLLISYEKKHSPEFYEQLKKQEPKNLSDLEIAARFIYLNKTGYNGLYRVNSQAISEYLNNSNCQILNQDYQQLLPLIKENDFLFVDPPYDSEKTILLNGLSVKQNSNGFTSYTAGEKRASGAQEIFIGNYQLTERQAKEL
ncbi:1037_t:CDS:2, partial [Cetraspora pellucida]